MKRRAAVAIVIFLLVGGTAAAQTSGQDSAFVDLRRDGNGFGQLASMLTFAIERETADVALRSVAATARLNLTFDSRLSGLSTVISVPLRRRTVAATLVEIADAANIRMRVGGAAQLIVVAMPPRTMAATPPRRSADSIVALPRVVTEAQSMERTQFATPGKIGALSITGEALGKMPMFVEPDVLRAVQMLPGVEARSDYTAGFNVRGGENDQNLVLIDGFPIYNPYHLGGVFSTFIDPTVGRVDLLRGAMPAQYGGRLSSVLDVRSAEPVREDVHGTGELSLVSAVASVGKAFANDAGSWMVAGRRTYADAVLGALSSYEFPYHFQDFQAHVTRNVGGGVRLSTTLYHGVDELGNGSNEDGIAHWGNSVAGLAVAKRFDSPRLGGFRFDSVTTEHRLSVTRFSSNADVLSETLHASDQVTEDRIAGTLGFHREKFSHTVGYDVTWQRLDYDAVYSQPEFVDFLPPGSIEQRSNAMALYADEVWRPSSRLVAQVGLRFDEVPQARWSGFSPRVALKYFVDSNTAINVGGGSYAQWMHSLGREEEPIEPIQFWIASDTSLPVSRSRDVVAGIEHWLSPRRFVHVEAFHKRYSDVLRPNAFNDPGVNGDEFEPVSGASYGADLLVRQVSGKFTGWLAYTYTHSTRTSRDGSQFYPPQDRRHNLNLVGSWRLGSNVVGAHLAIASGLPTTPVLGEYARYRYGVISKHWDGPADDGFITGPFDSGRLPVYRRVDLSWTHPFAIRGQAFEGYLSILNLFNFKNPAAYMYEFNARPKRASFPNLPFAPTFGVKLAY